MYLILHVRPAPVSLARLELLDVVDDAVAEVLGAEGARLRGILPTATRRHLAELPAN